VGCMDKTSTAGAVVVARAFRTQFEIDPRPGGSYSFRTDDVPEIGILNVRGRFLEVTPHIRLVYTWRWQGDEAPETTVTVEFVPVDGRTEVRVRHGRWATETDRINHTQGWNDCLDRLERMLVSTTGTATGS
jgi:uncharacterized protein YndB with AHSA1/START domain